MNRESDSKPVHSLDEYEFKKCDCGCVPKIPSLFEMAELRKKRYEELRKKEVKSEVEKKEN